MMSNFVVERRILVGRIVTQHLDVPLHHLVEARDHLLCGAARSHGGAVRRVRGQQRIDIGRNTGVVAVPVPGGRARRRCAGGPRVLKRHERALRLGEAIGISAASPKHDACREKQQAGHELNSQGPGHGNVVNHGVARRSASASVQRTTAARANGA